MPGNCNGKGCAHHKVSLTGENPRCSLGVAVHSDLEATDTALCSSGEPVLVHPRDSYSCRWLNNVAASSYPVVIPNTYRYFELVDAAPKFVIGKPIGENSDCCPLEAQSPDPAH